MSRVEAHSARAIGTSAAKWSQWRWPLAILIAGIAVAAPTSAAGGKANSLVCGQTVTESVVLSADLDCSGSGLLIASPGITIDLNGHTISGSGLGSGVGVLSGGTGATVKNGTIRGFERGVGVVDVLAELSLQHLVILSNGVGVFTNISGFVRIEDSEITHNAGDGIFLQETDNVWVLRSRVSDNGGYGIDAFYSVDRALYQDNVVSRNDTGGILVSRSTSTIIGNTANANGGDGIRVFEGDEFLLSRYLVTHNRADRNANYGIAQMPGMPDPQSNTAKNNGNPAQCLNITCTPN